MIQARTKLLPPIIVIITFPKTITGTMMNDIPIIMVPIAAARSKSSMIQARTKLVPPVMVIITFPITITGTMMNVIPIIMVPITGKKTSLAGLKVTQIDHFLLLP